VLSVAVELALVVHDHIEVTIKEGGRSWWICYIGFTGSLARPGASIIVVFFVEVVHYRILRVDQFVDVGHEIANGFCVSFVDLLEQLDVGDSLFVLGNDVVVFDSKCVAVLEVAVSILAESFITSHSYSGKVVSIARTIVGRLVVGPEEMRQRCPGGDALCWEVVEPQEWRLAHHEGKYPAMWSSLPPEARAAMLYILSHILGSEQSSYFSIAGLKSFGYLIVWRRREKAGKFLTAPGLADGA
jgi:hypothetical protein